MTFKRNNWILILKIVGLFFTTSLIAFCFIRKLYIYESILIPFGIYQLVNLYKLYTAIQDELEQFIESIYYRDFTRKYNIKKNYNNIKPLRQAFNDINALFKEISKEKEAQHQYLKNILQLVEAGILCFNQQDGSIIWMNDALKKIIQFPYLKNVNGLAKRDQNLSQLILSIHPGEQIITDLNRNNVTYKILLSASVFRMETTDYKLIVFQNIHETLEKTEAEAWQKLLRVLTHELMNSIAPIASLSSTLKEKLETTTEFNDTSTIEDLKLGIETIEKRSEGLLKFASTYQTLNKVSISQLKNVFVRDIFENVCRLLTPVLQSRNIELEIILEKTNIQIQADVPLIEQVLINLILNAKDALINILEPKIIVKAKIDENKKTIIQIIDNGCGIEKDLLYHYLIYISPKLA